MTNRLYYGDNLEVLREHLADASVDLIYFDPPFHSNASYNVLFRAPAKNGVGGRHRCQHRGVRRYLAVGAVGGGRAGRYPFVGRSKAPSRHRRSGRARAGDVGCAVGGGAQAVEVRVEKLGRYLLRAVRTFYFASSKASSSG